MYENGGNTTHRFLDGHPECFVYPFESQLGTALVLDHLTSMFPVKYRWPEFPLSGTPAGDYRAIIDEETRVRTRTPFVSKFRDYPLELDDDHRLARFLEVQAGSPRCRATVVAAFFRATFDAWTNRHGSGRETVYVGYSPIVVVDAEKILADFPQSHILHVLRNPWAAYADTKKRALPLSLPHYMTAWATVQYHARIAQRAAPDRVHILRYEDLIADPAGVLAGVCRKVRVEPSPCLAIPSWNGEPLREVNPWGTIRHATPSANQAAADELAPAERDEVRRRAAPFLETFGYA